MTECAELTTTAVPPILGELLGICGGVGAGKSSLLSLLLSQVRHTVRDEDSTAHAHTHTLALFLSHAHTCTHTHKSAHPNEACRPFDPSLITCPLYCLLSSGRQDSLDKR